jgi:hypothetical protein
MQQTVLVLGVERQGGRIVLVQRGVGELQRELTVRSVAFSRTVAGLPQVGGRLTLWRLTMLAAALARPTGRPRRIRTDL